MDYTITIDDAGLPQVSLEKSSGLFNNVFLSLTIGKGDWWFDPSFGLRKRRRLKNTPSAARLLEQDHKEALQWMIDSGRAVSVEVTSEPAGRNRLKLSAAVVGAGGETATYDKFIQVI